MWNRKIAIFSASLYNWQPFVTDEFYKNASDGQTDHWEKSYILWKVCVLIVPTTGCTHFQTAVYSVLVIVLDTKRS